MVNYVVFVAGLLAMVTFQAPPPKEPEPAKPEAEQKPAETPETPERIHISRRASQPEEQIDEAVAAAQRELLEKWSKIQSLSATVGTKEEVVRGEHTQEWEGIGTYECKPRGDVLLIRMDITTSAVQPPGSEPVVTGVRVLTVCDGEAVYSLRDKFGQKQAVKVGMEHVQIVEVGGPLLFKRLRQTNTLKVLPDETINGKPVCVMEGTPKPGSSRRRLFYFEKETGALIKWVVEDPERKVKRTVTMTDLKLNLELSDDLFVFKVPEGVEVRDLTPPKPEVESGE
jgi:outer membrane lipoprotein-sorting protein